MRSALRSIVLLAALASANPSWGEPHRDLVIEEMVSEQRIALVIGNSAYRDAPLKNPVNDARAMTASLKAVGFEVIQQLDADRLQMHRSIREFGNRISRGGVGLFYYAGHGIQIDGQNYLVPTDANVQHEDEVQDFCVLASSVLRKMNSAGNRVNIVVLDACRNNPFARSFRSSTRGLARMDAPAGTFLAYATGPGKVAADGEGDNGLYTANLLQHLQEPGVKIEDVFKQVRIKVMDSSDRAQVPWESSSLTGDFYFVVPQLVPPPPPKVQAYLQVYVNPVAGQVFVNDGDYGKTVPGQALNLTGFRPGNSRVRVEAPGYQAAEQQVTLHANQWTTATFNLKPTNPVPPPPPQPLKASLLVKVGPVAASVYVDGHYRDQASPQKDLMLSDLQPGQKEIRVEAQGYQAVKESHQLLGGQRTELTFVLKKKTTVIKPTPDVTDDMVRVGNRGFSIDRHEVTNAQFAQFLNAQGKGGLADQIERIEENGAQYRPLTSFADHPVVEVTWHEAAAYCEWAGKRLPKAGEWQQACEGEDNRTYPWGSQSPNAQLANFRHQANPHQGTAPVGSFPAGVGPYGSHDMSGNVLEWTASARDNELELRGGSWRRNKNYQRCTSNYYIEPDKRYDHFGFRCAR